MNEILKLEDIEKLMEDSREAVEYQNVCFFYSLFIKLIGNFFQEVSNLLSGGLSRADERDVEDELNELIRAEESNEIGRLPDVPHRRERKQFSEELF